MTGHRDARSLALLSSSIRGSSKNRISPPHRAASVPESLSEARSRWGLCPRSEHPALNVTYDLGRLGFSLDSASLNRVGCLSALCINLIQLGDEFDAFSNELRIIICVFEECAPQVRPAVGKREGVPLRSARLSCLPRAMCARARLRKVALRLHILACAYAKPSALT